MVKFILKILIFLALTTLATSTNLVKLPLENWEFKIDGKFNNKWYKANIPSNIYLDLIQNKLIQQDLYYRDNFQKTSWIHNQIVFYRIKFNQTQSMKTLKLKQIVFEGLDTYATIKLNNQKLLTTNNSYIKYVIPTKLIKSFEQNIIQIQFKPSQLIDRKSQQFQRLPFAYGWTRKPPYQYSWDWAPKILSVGIWQKAYILAYESKRIDYVWFRNKLISQNQAIINIAIVLKTQSFINIMADVPAEAIIYLQDKIVAKIFIKQKVGYKDILIQKPKLWWPHNVGDPYVYKFKIQLKLNGQMIQSQSYIHGIRRIQLNTTNGAFQFIINGYPVYAKGANYVPPDMLYPKFTNKFYKTQFNLQNYLDTIIQSNFNMIRVWGGGQYQSNQFYQQCSIRGIMIFQDFMFSVNIYPGTQSFLRSCEQQVKQQIRRIRNYPALALWSGNNQILQGILAWGWGSDDYKKNYDLLFQKLIRKIIEFQSPDISYIPSSPMYGSGGDSSKGDIHSWFVWAAGGGFDSYQSVIGRFNSQFGTQAFPVWETVKNFTLPDDRSYNSRILLKHERHNSQFMTLRKYINQHMNPSKNFQMQVYQSGIVQAYAIKIAIAAQRSNKPKTWGTLYWQFNDAWPGISWSSVDYYGRWKPLQYYAKKHYMDICVFFVRSAFVKEVNINVVSDRLIETQAKLNLMIYNFQGDILFNKTQNLVLKPNEVKNYLIIKQSELEKYLNGNDIKSIVLYGQVSAGKSLHTNTFFFTTYKNLKLSKSILKYSLNYNQNTITLTSNKFLKNLYISHPQIYIKLSDNYFDVIPNKTIIVHLDNAKLSDISQQILFRSLYDTYSEQQGIQLQRL